MNLRDVPDDVYATLVDAAAANRQSLSAYVVDQLSEVARVVRLGDYLSAYAPPTGTGISVEDAAAAHDRGRIVVPGRPCHEFHMLTVQRSTRFQRRAKAFAFALAGAFQAEFGRHDHENGRVKKRRHGIAPPAQ